MRQAGISGFEMEVLDKNRKFWIIYRIFRSEMEILDLM